MQRKSWIAEFGNPTEEDHKDHKQCKTRNACGYGNTIMVCPACKQVVLISVYVAMFPDSYACPYCGNSLQEQK